MQQHNTATQQRKTAASSAEHPEYAAAQEQTNMQPQQNTMPNPPNVITTKDHLYLKDMMSWNLNAMKKAYFFSELCQDPDVKTALDQSCQMHANHYQKLLNHLQNASQSQGMQA